MTDTIRDLLISLSSHMAYMQGQLEARHELDDPEDYYWYRESVLLRQKVTDALADGPAVPEGREPASVVGEPSDKELLELMHKSMRDDLAEVSRLAALQAGTDPGVFRVCLNYDVAKFARAVLARWGHQPAPPAEGEVAEFVEWLQEEADDYKCIGCEDSAAKCERAAELLQRQALVPVSVSDALIKAECALSDIAEGEPMTDEGDPLQWAERRCADTLAIIRPTMRQHKIRTSEWPPLPPPTDKEPTRLRNCPTHGQQPPWAWGCPECVRQLREELAALQQRHPEPVPVSERLPGPEDCDAEGRCWWGDAGDDEFVPSWRLCEQPDKSCFNHWLPHWALPVREKQDKR